MNIACHLWVLNSNITMQTFLWTLWKLNIYRDDARWTTKNSLAQKSETWFHYTRRTCTCSIHGGIRSDGAQKVEQNDN